MSFADTYPYKNLETCPALATVFWRAPTYTLCTNDFIHGVYKRAKPIATSHRHISLQHPDNRQVLLFDIDHQDCVDRWKQVGLPVPTWISLNPDNGRGHYGYALSSPVIGFETRESKTTKWLKAIQLSMQTALSSDPHYSQRLTKNPLHPYWITYAFDVLYSLEELTEYFPRGLLTARNQSFDHLFHEGRNSGLFFELRMSMMKQWDRIAKLPQPTAIALVESEAFQISARANPNNPLSSTEVRQISRSVCRWLQQSYSPSKFAKKFSNKQHYRQLKSAIKRKSSTREILYQALSKAQEQGATPTVSLVASMACCSRQAIYKFHPEIVDAIKLAKAQSAQKFS